MLKKFRDMLGGGSGDDAVKRPPYAIKASDLDHNFGLCYPLPTDGNNAPYTIERLSDGGFRFRGQRIFDVCENGVPVQYRFFAERLEDLSA
jgi:hypothetical protein